MSVLKYEVRDFVHIAAVVDRAVALTRKFDPTLIWQ